MLMKEFCDIEYYFEEIIKKYEGIMYDDVDVIDAIPTYGETGYYVRYNIVTHYSGGVLSSNNLGFIHINEIRNEFNNRHYFTKQRKRKLLYLEMMENGFKKGRQNIVS